MYKNVILQYQALKKHSAGDMVLCSRRWMWLMDPQFPSPLPDHRGALGQPFLDRMRTNALKWHLSQPCHEFNRTFSVYAVLGLSTWLLLQCYYLLYLMSRLDVGIDLSLHASCPEFPGVQVLRDGRDLSLHWGCSHMVLRCVNVLCNQQGCVDAP